jgi:hypothetical protein
MFSQHDIIHMSKRTKEIHKKVFGPNSVFVKYTAEGRVRELSDTNGNALLVVL